MIRIFSRFGLMISVLFLLYACENQLIYNSYQYISGKTWSKSDTITFTPEISDSLSEYYTYIEIRNHNSYPYQDLHLAISYNMPDTLSFKTDTLKLQIADKEGRWLGDGWGGLYQLSFSIATLKANTTGPYKFYINHCMADETITGINDIGIRIEKAD